MVPSDVLTNQAEMSIIGAIILDEKSLTKIIDKVSVEDFFCSDLREIYKSILKLWDSGKSIDFVTVMNEFSNKKFFLQKTN